MPALSNDIRYAARKALRSPGFTAVTIVTLAIGLSATTSMLSVVNSVLLEPLPFADPGRIVFVESTDSRGQPLPVSPQDLIDYHRQSSSFSSLAAVEGGESANLSRADGPTARLNEARVGAAFFHVLGLRPAAGRFFVTGEDSASAAKTVVLSSAAWARYFGADSRVVGQSMTLDGESYRVIGVAPREATFPQHPDIWIPAVWHDYELGDNARGFHAVSAIARLAPGIQPPAARQELETIAARLARTYPQHDAKIGAYLNPLQDELVGDVGRALWPMLGAVAFVLLIACANVANLLLARAAARESEIAVRAALGAGRGAIARQLVVESLFLAAIGAALGTMLSLWTIDAVVAFGPQTLPRIGEIAVDGRALAFTVAVTALTGVLFGLVPALHAARSDVSRLLRGGRGTGGASRWNAGRTRSAFVLVELALSMVLLVGAGLMVRGFARLIRTSPGFRPAHLVVFDAALADKKYEYDNATIQFGNDVRAKLLALPGVRGVGIAAQRPFDPEPQFGASTAFTVDGEPKPQPGSESVSHIYPVSPSYFAALGMSLARGRFFEDAENRLDAPPVLVVNETLAKRYFAGRDPVGKHLTFGLSHNTTPNPADTVRLRGEVVGVVKDVASSALGEKPEPAAYFPYGVAPFAATFAVRVDGDPSLVEAAAYRIVRGVDPTAAVYEDGTMDDAMAASVARPRFYTMLLGGFAAIALLLATLGIFGVVSYSVKLRTREFGIRIALGATTTRIARSVVAGGLVLAVAGIGVGALGAALLTGAIKSLLYGIDPLDLPTYLIVAALLAGIASLAAWLPARQAGRVDPVIAMRVD